MSGGRGPVPKDPSKRARTNKDAAALAVVTVLPVESKPVLPDTFGVLRAKTGYEVLPYPQETRDWWENWISSPFAEGFDALAWERLRLAAALHARAVLGDMESFKEFRLHMALFPETPADRLRQRIQVAQAVGAEVDATQKAMSARDRFGGMRVTQDRPSGALEA